MSFGEIVLAVLAAALALRVAYHAWHVATLRRWLREPSLERLPRGRGVWEDLLAELHRYLRRRDADAAEIGRALTRFRAAWQWDGGPAVLQSRATDDTGMVQPTRAAFAAERGLRGVFHYNAIASWQIDEKGEASNVYA